MKFRKKPVVINAVQWDGQWDTKPAWLVDNYGTYVEVQDDCTLAICTLEGTMIANIGDWIIQGVKDEIYPCKPDIFEATYEMVEE